MKRQDAVKGILPESGQPSSAGVWENPRQCRFEFWARSLFMRRLARYGWIKYEAAFTPGCFERWLARIEDRLLATAG